LGRGAFGGGFGLGGFGFGEGPVLTDGRTSSFELTLVPPIISIRLGANP
jgi:hypothetical protein